MEQTAKIFMNGRSQAVRLPVNFRFNTLASLGQLIAKIRQGLRPSKLSAIVLRINGLFYGT